MKSLISAIIVASFLFICVTADNFVTNISLPLPPSTESGYILGPNSVCPTLASTASSCDNSTLETWSSYLQSLKTFAPLACKKWRLSDLQMLHNGSISPSDFCSQFVGISTQVHTLCTLGFSIASTTEYYLMVMTNNLLYAGIQCLDMAIRTQTAMLCAACHNLTAYSTPPYELPTDVYNQYSAACIAFKTTVSDGFKSILNYLDDNFMAFNRKFNALSSSDRELAAGLLSYFESVVTTVSSYSNHWDTPTSATQIDVASVFTDIKTIFSNMNGLTAVPVSMSPGGTIDTTYFNYALLEETIGKNSLYVTGFSLKDIVSTDNNPYDFYAYYNATSPNMLFNTAFYSLQNYSYARPKEFVQIAWVTTVCSVCFLLMCFAIFFLVRRKKIKKNNSKLTPV